MKYQLHIILSFFLLYSSLEAQNIQFVFRYDDFMLVNDSTNEKVIRLFLKYNIPVVLGVIPCDDREDLVLDKNYHYLDSLKKAVHDGSVEIALHGLNHRRMTPYGEFTGLSLEEQTRRIKKGKQLLDSVFNYNIMTFIPPWNAHDGNTVTALKTNNIYIVSSSIYDVWSETVFYPESTDDYHMLDGLIKNNQTFGGIIVIMLHASDFKTNKSFEDFENVLINLKKDTSITFYTFKGIENAGIYINKFQSEDLIRSNLLIKILKLKNVFLSYRTIVGIRMLNTILYLLVIFLAYFIGQLIVLKNHKHNIIQYFILSMLAVLIALSTWYCWWGPLKLAFIFLLIALVLPFIFRFFKIYNLHIKIHLKKK